MAGLDGLRSLLPKSTVLFYRNPLTIVRGERQFLFDKNNRKYLDMFGGIVTVSVGHCHPLVIKFLLISLLSSDGKGKEEGFYFTKSLYFVLQYFTSVLFRNSKASSTYLHRFQKSECSLKRSSGSTMAHDVHLQHGAGFRIRPSAHFNAPRTAICKFKKIQFSPKENKIKIYVETIQNKKIF